MKDSIKKIGLLAGAGEVPAHFAIRAAQKGICIVAVSFSDEIHTKLAPLVEKAYSVGIGKPGKIFKTFNGLNVAFLGITYKSFTNTLTGSLTLSIAKELLEKGCIIKAFDPLVSHESSYLHNGITITSDIDTCLEGCDVLIIMIEKPEFRQLTVEHLKNIIGKKVIIDAANMLNADEFIQEGFQYAGIGTGYSSKV